jgi:predicted ATPase
MIHGIVSIEVEEDDQKREYRVNFRMRDGRTFSSRVISDGTLRVLALLTLLHDPTHRGLVCFEEPENGIHPLRLRALVEKLRFLVSHPSETVGSPIQPLSQIIMNSHSPVVLSCLNEGRQHVVYPRRPGFGKSTRKIKVTFCRVIGKIP